MQSVQRIHCMPCDNLRLRSCMKLTNFTEAWVLSVIRDNSDSGGLSVLFFVFACLFPVLWMMELLWSGMA